jgi:hypothetical protein
MKIVFYIITGAFFLFGVFARSNLNGLPNVSLYNLFFLSVGMFCCAIMTQLFLGLTWKFISERINPLAVLPLGGAMTGLWIGVGVRSLVGWDFAALGRLSPILFLGFGILLGWYIWDHKFRLHGCVARICK